MPDPANLRQTFIDLTERFVEELQKECGERLVSVVLYGSLGRGDAIRPDSDIDLLIVAKDLPAESLDRQKIIRQIRECLETEWGELRKEGIHPYFSCILKTPEEASYHSPLYLDMTEDAKLLVDRGNFFGKILQDMQNKMQKLGSRRIWVGGKWYWELKPDYQFGEVFEI